jgi:hypothetical protein
LIHNIFPWKDLFLKSSKPTQVNYRRIYCADIEQRRQNVRDVKTGALIGSKTSWGNLVSDSRPKYLAADFMDFVLCLIWLGRLGVCTFFCLALKWKIIFSFVIQIASMEKVIDWTDNS